ncbi:hybrid sensor histidine kinase/response regulator [uncultured Massilia sp.]|uniref:hybrid sensor histidine kinase/response regulator n=1 Tax=uncultured Massilia sp. TaxID=169973 RepID=UPI0025E68FFC|nr:response regulator [uncultured Massilia sp.]
MSRDHDGNGPGDLSGDLSGMSMLDLFRLEAEDQARALTDGLLLLERGAAGPDTLEALMRAAHSIKGAAAIVGLETAVRLAHAMEDVFVAAQRGRLRLGAADVDALLAGVDLMQRLAAGTDAAAATAVDAAVAALGRLRGRGPGPLLRPTAAPDAAPAAMAPPTATPAPTPVPPAPATPIPAAPAAPAAAPATPAAAAASDELLALASQARLHAGQMRPWIAALQRDKRQQRLLAETLGQLQEAAAASGDPAVLELVRQALERARPLQGGLQRAIADAETYEHRALNLSARLADGLLGLRMCPFREGVHALPRMVRDLARGLGKDVRVEIAGAGTLVDRAVLAKVEGPLNQLLRNAVDHGMEDPDERRAAGKPAHGTIRLEARHRGGMLAIEVADDGRGVDPARIRQAVLARGLAAPAVAEALSQAELMEFLFLPGFSLKDGATELSGRGVGMDVVHEAVRALNGSVRAESQPGRGFCTAMTLPLTQSIVRALVVDVAGEAYALPIARIGRVLRVARSAVRTLAGRQYLELDGGQVGLAPAAQVLDLGEAAAADLLDVVVIGAARERYGLVVDAVRGEQSLTVQPLEPTFGKLRDVAAAALLDDGAPALVLDVPDLLLSIARLLGEGAPLRLAAGAATRQGRRRVLVVDDSLTVREMQRKLLAARGYAVEVALDGIDGWNQLRAGAFDLVVTDVDMPRLDGIGLLERIRRDPRLHKLPVMIVSYKDRPEDRARGMEAGADYYLAKGAFHDATLLEAVQDLVGGPSFDTGEAP